MTVGVGVDLVEIDRLERALARRPRLADRLFTAAEQEYAGRHRRPARQLAARFAAKEAAVKALALDRGASLKEIEVVAGVPPQLRLHGAVRQRAAEIGATLRVSLTHERGMAAAVVIAEPDEAGHAA